MSDDELLGQLLAHPAWPLLARRAADYKRRQGRILAANFLLKNSQPPYERLQYERGFIDGMRFLLKQPQASFAEFQKELARERKEVT